MHEGDHNPAVTPVEHHTETNVFTSAVPRDTENDSTETNDGSREELDNEINRDVEGISNEVKTAADF